jgi:hypothetical protein
MSLLILLRKSAPVNRFHNLLINSIDSSEGDSALLCSGFFQEMNNYSASLDSGLCLSLLNNNVALTTIGVHNRMWLNRYRDFRNVLVNNGVNINALITNNFHWHAKVFILKKEVILILINKKINKLNKIVNRAILIYFIYFLLLLILK